MPQGSGVRKFFQNNWEKMALWAILIGLIYLFKPFFLLIFATFLVTYITKSAVDRICQRVNLGYRLTTVIVFSLFVGLLATAGAWIGPRLVIQSNQILVKFAGNGEAERREKVDRFAKRIVEKIVGEEKAQEVMASEGYAAAMKALRAEATDAATTAMPHVLGTLLHLIRLGWELVISLLLAILFSFILVLDWRRIADKVRELETSRIRTFYLGAAPHLQALGSVLGKAFRAQAIIATCNAILTAIGLSIFGVPNVVLLSAIVFICGFIPIVGTFLSSIPILLFGLEFGGLSLVFKLVILILIVHAFEAYILNPKITANVLHVHPMLILVLLLVGERFFGIWGMVVGVPVGYYVISVLTKKDETLAVEQQEPAKG